MATYTNNSMVTLASGTRYYYPKIAVGSYCTLTFEGSSLTAGEVRFITVGSDTVKVVTDEYGNASLSLMPFMRADAASNNLQNNPCVSTNYWRGSLTLTVSLPDDSTVESTVTIYYILGDCPPRKDIVTEYWRTYNMGMPTNYNVCAVDWANHYTSGTPNNLTAFRACWDNPSTWVTPPENDNDITVEVLQVCSSSIKTGNVTYHFTTDKRTENVIQVRWIDQRGNLNTRKFILGGEGYSAASEGAYKRPHDTKVIVSNSYDYGRDEWVNVTPQRTLTFGDDAIVMGQWEWLNSLAASQVVEFYKDGIWHRCNIVDSAMERDPRKSTFNVSFKISVPTDENVEI